MHQALGLQESHADPKQVAAALCRKEQHGRRCRQGRLAAGAPGGASLPGGPLRDRLQLAYDCWNLLAVTEGRLPPSVLPAQGYKEPSLSYGSAIEAPGGTGLLRDALRTMPGMLSFLHPRALPSSLLRVLRWMSMATA